MFVKKAGGNFIYEFKQKLCQKCLDEIISVTKSRFPIIQRVAKVCTHHDWNEPNTFNDIKGAIFKTRLPFYFIVLK